MRARLHVLGGLSTLLLLAAACDDPRRASPTATTALGPPGPPASSAPSSRSAADPALLDRLARSALFDDRPARRVLYSWTTAEQIAELTRRPLLLTRTEPAQGGRSLFEVRRSQSGSVVARLLDEPPFAARRFAWVNPWATLRGWEGESYGDRLIRITLRDDAITAVFTPDDKASPEWRFYSLDAAEISVNDVAQHPERIAVIYHLVAGVAGGEKEALPYREHVLCNESMIEAWEVGTPRVREEIAGQLDLLRRVRADLDRAAPEPRPAAWPFFVARTVWPSRPAGDPALASLYEANLAFANDRYRLAPAVLDEVIKALAALPPGDPLEHRPDLPFPGFDPSFQGGLPTQLSTTQNRLTKCFPRGDLGCLPLALPSGSAAPTASIKAPPLSSTIPCFRRNTFMRCPRPPAKP